jgi:hypothetical protein
MSTVQSNFVEAAQKYFTSYLHCNNLARYFLM